MRAICNTNSFGKKLALVSRGVSARSTIQLLAGILLEAREGGGARLFVPNYADARPVLELRTHLNLLPSIVPVHV